MSDLEARVMTLHHNVSGVWVTAEDYLELEAKLAKAVRLLNAWVSLATQCTIEEGVCCCGDHMDTHADPMDCGHLPVDNGVYAATSLRKETSTAISELTGGKDE